MTSDDKRQAAIDRIQAQLRAMDLGHLYCAHGQRMFCCDLLDILCDDEPTVATEAPPNDAATATGMYDAW